MDPSTVAPRLPPPLARYAAPLCFWSDYYGIDLWTLAGIIWVETKAGTDPNLDRPGPGGMGDCENGVWYGHGLGQIDSRFHATMVDCILGDGSHAWADAAFNIGFAASIYAFFLAKLNGDPVAAVAAYNAGLSATQKALAVLQPDASTDAKVQALDAVTAAPHHYVSEVLKYRDQYLSGGSSQP